MNMNDALLFDSEIEDAVKHINRLREILRKYDNSDKYQEKWVRDSVTPAVTSLNAALSHIAGARYFLEDILDEADEQFRIDEMAAGENFE